MATPGTASAHHSEGWPTVISTPPIRRLVGGALRRYRENLGYTLGDAARILECDPSKVSRIESGQRGIRAKELRELLSEYGIGDEQQAVLAAMASPRGGSGWYRAYADVLPAAYQDYLVLEDGASKVMAYEAQRIPALLQTPAYARALAEADQGLLDADAWDGAVAATLARQKAILGERKPDIHLVIGEAALHQKVGGQVVMEGQLGLLAGVSGDSGRITLQILPFEAGAHAAAAIGSFAILQYAEVPGPGVVHMDGATGGICLESAADLAAHARVFEQLRALALSPAQSALLLWGLADV
jgi:transcriptional regulator with XRE-family HTH domain